MPPRRDLAYTYLVSFGATVVGKFSEVSGLDSGLSITLRRGAASAMLVGWLKAAHDGGADPRRITIAQVDTARRSARSWVLSGALPKKYEAATLSATANEIAMEEIQLTCEGIEPAS